MSKVTPFLWFVEDAKRAAEFYVSLFDDLRILGSNASLLIGFAGDPLRDVPPDNVNGRIVAVALVASQRLAHNLNEPAQSALTGEPFAH